MKMSLFIGKGKKKMKVLLDTNVHPKLKIKNPTPTNKEGEIAKEYISIDTSNDNKSKWRITSLYIAPFLNLLLEGKLAPSTGP